MKQRIGWWALVGFAVACSWVIYGMIAGPNHNLSRWIAPAVTAPASLLGRIVPLTFYLFILLNAAVYALFGFSVELVRRRHL
jgi:hypothetical protein